MGSTQFRMLFLSSDCSSVRRTDEMGALEGKSLTAIVVVEKGLVIAMGLI